MIDPTSQVRFLYADYSRGGTHLRWVAKDQNRRKLFSLSVEEGDRFRKTKDLVVVRDRRISQAVDAGHGRSSRRVFHVNIQDIEDMSEDVIHHAAVLMDVYDTGEMELVHMDWAKVREIGAQDPAFLPRGFKLAWTDDWVIFRSGDTLQKVHRNPPIY